MEIAKLFNALPSAGSQGVIWGIMAIGVYITYRILDVADLTVDGSIATGGAVAAVLIIGGCNVWVAMVAAFLVGMLAGLATGIFHTFMGILAILAGILTQIALYSINIRIPRFLPDFARGLAEHYKAHGLCSALVLSPPAAGKTTFLRSIAYLLASGNYPQPRRVGIADERCELFLPDKMGALIDCVRDMPKAAGIELLTRSMSPEVIVCDELAESESTAVAETQNSGVCLIASAHAPDYAGAMRRPFLKRLCDNGIFELFVLLHAEEGYRYDLYIP